MHRKLLLLSLILSGCATLSLAQDSLLIGAGDKLHVRVFDTPEMEQHPQVTDSGTVPLMLLGNVKLPA